jgi:hypothetical protein
VIVSLACGAPVTDSPGSPAAQATNARRTAVAEVQAIIANKPTQTPIPLGTATPTPSCRDALWWSDARLHVGETRTVQGMVVGHRSGSSGFLLLELGQPYPDPTGILVRVPQTPDPETEGHTVCATGKIVMDEGTTVIELANISALKVDPA